LNDVAVSRFVEPAGPRPSDSSSLPNGSPDQNDDEDDEDKSTSSEPPPLSLLSWTGE
jgi:hypothetical protein